MVISHDGGINIPLYSYSCPSCGQGFERYLPLSRWQEVQFCGCGHPTDRLISIPIMVIAQQECRYDSPVTGEPITTWQQRRNDLDRHNCQPYDPEMKTDATRRVVEMDNRLDQSVDETVESAWEKMPSKVKERIANEVDSGLVPEIVRSTPTP